VGGLITWRFLIGSQHDARHERRTGAQLVDEPMHAEHAAVVAERDFSAVSIRMSNRPCAAIKEIRRASFLVGDEPKLPLSSCDRRCNCQYAFHDDRRRHNDRRYPSADLHDINGTSSFGDELRNGWDRRRRVEPYQGIY
jgi:hypothetical protein